MNNRGNNIFYVNNCKQSTHLLFKQINYLILTDISHYFMQFCGILCEIRLFFHFIKFESIRDNFGTNSKRKLKYYAKPSSQTNRFSIDYFDPIWRVCSSPHVLIYINVLTNWFHSTELLSTSFTMLNWLETFDVWMINQLL